MDIKPDNMEDLTEVITKASFHPTSCNLLVYSSSRGSLRLIDLRENALADRCSKVFEIEEDPAEKSFFSEIISSISDVQFTPNGNCLVSRDYISLKVWDVRYESKPLEIIPVQDYLRPRLCDLYENDCIFDKFECASSPDGSSFVTGSYNDDFFIYDSKSKSGQTLSACPPLQYGSKSQAENTSRRNSNVQVSVDEMNFSKKSLHTAWHPRADVVAVASLNNLYIYQ